MTDTPKIKCPYCGKLAKRVSGRFVYPHLQYLWKKTFWLCRGCDAYVGCHGRSHRPLGRLANRELREAKIAAHAAFDPIWKSGAMKRSEAYGWLAEQLGIYKSDCHIGMFDVDMCRKVTEVCREYVHA